MINDLKQGTRPNNPEASAEVHLKQNALRVSLIFMAANAPMFFVYIYLVSQLQVWQSNPLIALVTCMFASSVVSTVLILRNRVVTGVWIIIGIIAAFLPVFVLLQSGLGLVLGLSSLMGISMIAGLALPQKYIMRALIIAGISAILTILLDLLTPYPRITIPIIEASVPVIVALAILGFSFFVVREFPNYSLRVKLIIAFTLVTIIPLAILGVYNNYTTTRNLTQGSRDQLTELSYLVAQRYDVFIGDQLRQIRAEAQERAFGDYLLVLETGRHLNIDQSTVAQGLTALQRKDPEFIRSYAILDNDGRNILDTELQNLGRNEGKEGYFLATVQQDQAYASNIVFNSNGESSIFFAAPIKDNAGNILGVLRVEYNGAILQSIAKTIVPESPDIFITMVDRNTYLRLAYTGREDLLFTTYKKYSSLELTALQASGKLPGGTAQQILVDTDSAIVSGIDDISKNMFFQAHSSSLNADAIHTGALLSTQPWIVVAGESVASNIQAIRLQTLQTLLISFALALLAILLAFFAAQLLVTPVTSLIKVAEQIAAGDISARANVAVKDEIGTLSDTFNKMTDELNQTLSSLEARVAERTTDLEIARQQSERRAGELTAIGEISRLISGEQRFETLLPLIARLVSQRFNFYHTGIYLLDETSRFAVLQAADSEGGRKLMARQHQLLVEEDDVVGYASRHSVPRIILDVGQDAASFNTPELPNTRSEMALPLNSRGRTLGVLDVQSDRPGAFTEDDAKTLGILADQIAIAIDNARLFQQTQLALNEYQTLYRQNIKEGWSAFGREESVVGYQQTIAGGRKLNKPVETQEIRNAVNQGNLVVVQPDANNTDSYIVIPVKLRGQIIGTIRVQAPIKNRLWTKDEINLAEAMSERLSLALENARLIQESQKQAIKEQTITEVTSKIGTSIDLKNVLQTAVEELGRALPGSDVLIRFDTNGKK